MPSVYKMLIYDIMDKDCVFDVVTNNLRTLGIKSRVKRNVRKAEGSDKHGENFTKVFNVPLSQQPLDGVQLSSGAIVHVPIFVKHAIITLDKHINQEGLFRKAGSQARLKELVSRLDCGNELSDKYHAVDIANCLKKYFRDLPEPIIPYAYHDVFVRCGMLKSGAKIDAILMACLLLPTSHLNTLAFFMDFLNKVSLHESQNKMGTDNLARVIGPNVMPVRETTMTAMQNRLDAHLTIVKILIENSRHIGVLPKCVTDTLQQDSYRNTEMDIDRAAEDRFKEKKKKHRSGSLTRMFNGLKKIVGKNGSPENITNGNARLSLLDSSHGSPSKSCKKRKNVEQPSQALSTKKKRDSIDGMTSNAVSSSRSVLTPVSRDPNPTVRSPVTQKTKLRKYTSHIDHTVSQKFEKTKKLGMALDRFITKSRQKVNDLEIDEINDNKIAQSPIERRWSMTSGNSTKKILKKRTQNWSSSSLAVSPSIKRTRELYLKTTNDCYDPVFMDADVNLSDENVNLDSTRRRRSARHRPMDHHLELENSQEILLNHQRHEKNSSEEYVKIPKSEYEAIKNRVSAIESRISQEFNNIVHDTPKKLPINSVNDVQSEYEKTLGEAGIETIVSADHLARRLSKELKIRRSIEHKVIRSPSARRISTLRRRSQEKPVIARKRLSRTASWNISDETNKNNSMKNTENITNQNNTDSYCSDATNARLTSLHRQLCTLISYTAEHTGSTLSDDDQMSHENVNITKTTSNIRRASSFHGSEVTNDSFYFNNRMGELRKTHSQRNVIVDSAQTTNDMRMLEIREKRLSWKDASIYLEPGTPAKPTNHAPAVIQTGRASIAKLRTQNAGMVLAKAKLFDDNESKSTQETVTERTKRRNLQRGAKDVKTTPTGIEITRKKKCKSPKNIAGRSKLSQSPNDMTIGSYNRQSIDKRSAYRQSPTIDQENRRATEEFLSPISHDTRRRVQSTPNRNNTTILDNSNVSEITNTTIVSNTPHIKKPLGMKTPKSARSLVRRPAIDSRRTPLKAVPSSLGTPKRQSPRNVLKSRQLSRYVN